VYVCVCVTVDSQTERRRRDDGAIGTDGRCSGGDNEGLRQPAPPQTHGETQSLGQLAKRSRQRRSHRGQSEGEGVEAATRASHHAADLQIPPAALRKPQLRTPGSLMRNCLHLSLVLPKSIRPQHLADVTVSTSRKDMKAPVTVRHSFLEL